MKNKNNLLIVLIVVLSICIIGLSVFVVYNKVLKGNNDDVVDNGNNNTDNDVIDEEMNVEQKILYIVKDENNIEKKRLTDDYDSIENKDDILGEYKCTIKCYAEYPYIPSPQDKFVGESSVLISHYDDEKHSYVIRYNYITREVEDTYNKVLSSYSFSNDNFSIMVGKEDEQGIKFALLGKDGNMITDYIFDSLPSSKTYGYGVGLKAIDWYGPSSFAVAEVNNLYGIIDVSNGNTIVDFKYENIIILPNGYYSFMENDKWYLLDNNLNKLFNSGYDGVFSYDFGVLILNKLTDNKFSAQIVDYNGNELSNLIEFDNYFLKGYNYRGVIYEINNDEFSLSGGPGNYITFKYDKFNKTLSVVEN